MKLVATMIFFAIGVVAAGLYVLMSRPDAAWHDAARPLASPQRPIAEVPRVLVATPSAPTAAPGQDESPLNTSAVEAVAASPVEAVERLSNPGALPSDSGEEERIAAVKRRMAENLYRRGGRMLAGRFASRGLAPDDAKAIMRTYMEAMAGCLFDAARQEAQARSIDLDDFLADLEADLTRADSDRPGPLRPLAGLDRQAVERRAEPCVLDASQEAGIPFH